MLADRMNLSARRCVSNLRGSKSPVKQSRPMCCLRIVFAMLPILVLVSVSGCNIRPDLSPPGDIYTQRYQAVVHDPFPSDDLGPVIEGARPMEYERPLHEPTGLQTNPHSRPGFGF